MENRKGSGIFLGIVSVATLIVAIIGATFAYFSATTVSNEDALNLTAYEFKLALFVDKVYPLDGQSTALIPLNPTTTITGATAPNNTNLLYAINAAENKCIDSNGLQVCALYQVTIENQAVNEVTLSGTLLTFSNVAGQGEGRQPFKNLTYQEITGNHTNGTLELVGDPKQIPSANGEEIDIADITVEGATIGEDGQVTPGRGTSYVLVYLNDNGNQSEEMGASFSGQLKYSSQDGSGNELTGTFKLTGTESQD